MGGACSRRRREARAVREAMRQSMLQAPLSRGWEARIARLVDGSTRTYYVNHLRCRSTWRDPRRGRRGAERAPRERVPPYDRQDMRNRLARLRLAIGQPADDDPAELEVRLTRGPTLLAQSVELVQDASPLELKQRLRVQFIGEEGHDVGGVSRDWFLELSRALCGVTEAHAHDDHATDSEGQQHSDVVMASPAVQADTSSSSSSSESTLQASPRELSARGSNTDVEVEEEEGQDDAMREEAASGEASDDDGSIASHDSEPNGAVEHEVDDDEDEGDGEHEVEDDDDDDEGDVRGSMNVEEDDDYDEDEEDTVTAEVGMDAQGDTRDAGAASWSSEEVALTMTHHVEQSPQHQLRHKQYISSSVDSCSATEAGGLPSVLHRVSPDHYVYTLNPGVRDMELVEAAGRLVGMAVVHGMLMDIQLAPPLLATLVGAPVTADLLPTHDPVLHQNLSWILDNDPEPLDLTFVVTSDHGDNVEEVELVPGGADVAVSLDNRHDYVERMAVWRMQGQCEAQLTAFARGFHAMCPLSALEQWKDHELQLAVSGVQGSAVDVEEWKAHTEYAEGWGEWTPGVQQFWAALARMEEPQLRLVLRFATGTDRLPVGGFGALWGSSGPQWFTLGPAPERDNRYDEYGFEREVPALEDKAVLRLPTSHTCFNRIELPTYDSVDDLYDCLLLAVTHARGFGLH